MAQGESRAAGALTTERIVTEAVRLADAEGMARLSMRALGRRLGVEAMALYHYLPSKSALLDAMVDGVVGELAAPEGPWPEGLRRRCVSLHAMLAQHPWALGAIDSRTSPGPVTLAHEEAVIGWLRNHGFAPLAAVRAAAFADAFVYGFVLQELSLPAAEDPAALVGDILGRVPQDAYPALAEVRADVIDAGYRVGDDFGLGLDLLLGGLERLREP